VGNDAGHEGEEAGGVGCPLAAFIEKITTRIQDTVLGTPSGGTGQLVLAKPPVRRSARIAKGPNAGVPIEMLEKMAVARRLGSLPPTVSFTERLLQAYLALFDGPLSDMAVTAIEELVLTLKKTKKELPVMAARGGRQRMPLQVA
jgi:hypothetical protein